MNAPIRFCLIIAFGTLAPVALFYAWLFEHLLEPSLPLIPLAAASLALLGAGASGYHTAELFAELFADMERKETGR